MATPCPAASALHSGTTSTCGPTACPELDEFRDLGRGEPVGSRLHAGKGVGSRDSGIEFRCGEHSDRRTDAGVIAGIRQHGGEQGLLGRRHPRDLYLGCLLDSGDLGLLEIVETGNAGAGAVDVARTELGTER